MTSPTPPSLLELLNLRGESEPDTFTGQSQQQPWGRVFGGQVFAQAVVAAQRTIEDYRPLHSLHAYFLRPGNDQQPIKFAVQRLRDGRSFSARSVNAIQDGEAILAALGSFQEPGDGVEHDHPMPDAPDPHSLPTLAERYGHLNNFGTHMWARQRMMDVRYAFEPAYVSPATDGQHLQYMWVRCQEKLPDDQRIHLAVQAYASDYSMLDPALRRHGLTFITPGIKVASLDHVVWWHRQVRADQWLLHVIESPTAQGSRALGTAHVYTQDGTLVSTITQEGMIRIPASNEKS